jgi:PHD/YefM family antitoxin component YafN of YafNO toxin-antitoxin module
MAPQFITDNKGKKTAVVLSLKDYKKIMDELEELEDIKIYDKAKEGKEKFIPIKEAFKKSDSKRAKAKKNV